MVIPLGSSSTTFNLTDLVTSVIFSTYTGCWTWEHFFSVFCVEAKKCRKTPYFMRTLVKCFFNLLKKRCLYRRAREREHGYNRFEACSRWNEQRAKWCEHGYNTNERCTKPCVCRKRSAFPLTNQEETEDYSFLQVLLWAKRFGFD